MATQHKALARKVFEDVMTGGNLALVDELVTDSYVGHVPIEDIRGPEGAKRFEKMMRSAFPDMKVEVEDQVEEGDEVVTRWTCRGTHKGEFLGVQPTGRQIKIPGITIFRFDDGKLAEGWSIPDLMGIMQQLGAFR